MSWPRAGHRQQAQRRTGGGIQRAARACRSLPVALLAGPAIWCRARRSRRKPDVPAIGHDAEHQRRRPRRDDTTTGTLPAKEAEKPTPTTARKRTSVPRKTSTSNDEQSESDDAAVHRLRPALGPRPWPAADGRRLLDRRGAAPPASRQLTLSERSRSQHWKFATAQRPPARGPAVVCRCEGEVGVARSCTRGALATSSARGCVRASDGSSRGR